MSRHSFLRRLLPRGALRRDLWVTTADAAAFSVMVGCGETYLPAFTLALGFGPVAAGLMASVPILVAALVQLASPYAVARLGSDRAWVIACTTVQAASFVPLVWWAVRGGAALWQVLLAASIYWAAGMAGVSAWNSWMARLVPERMRTAYFAHRNRLGQFGVFFGFVVGGIVLQIGEAWHATRAAFAVLFTLAAASRLLSTLCLAACRELRSPLAVEMQAKPAGLPRRTAVLLRGMAARPSGTLVAFLCCFMFGVHFNGPYFTPYMLRELGFSYHAFMLVFATAFLSKAILLPSIGRLASRVGAPRMLAMACVAIMPLSLLWLPTGELGWLLCVQVVAGGCWAAYELAVALLFFEVVQDRERTGVLTVYNLALAVATVAGAGCGGLLLRALGEDRRAYAVLFVVSCLLRLVSLPLLARLLRQTAAAGR
ncbi:MAG: MFS transporter [Planctomycetia bacterium]